MRILRAIAVLTGLILPLLSHAQAAQLKVLESNALKTVMDELGPQFEKTTGNKLVSIVGTTTELRGMIEKGEAFDVAVFTKSALDDLAKQGKIADAPRLAIARSGIGVAVRKGAAKPDVSTPEAFKQAMLNAKSIGHTNAGTGPFNTRLFQKLGIYDQIKDKIKIIEGKLVAAAVNDGDVEIGIQQTNVIQPHPGTVYLGPLPAELMEYGKVAIGVLTGSKQPEVAAAFAKFAADPANAALLRKGAMEPPAS